MTITNAYRRCGLFSDLTRQCHPAGLLLTGRRRQIFYDVHKVKGEDADGHAHLSPSPVLPHILLQLDNVSLGERQLITVFPLKVKPCLTSRTT